MALVTGFEETTDWRGPDPAAYAPNVQARLTPPIAYRAVTMARSQRRSALNGDARATGLIETATAIRTVLRMKPLALLPASLAAAR
jgi:hypothetical protein